MRNVFSGLVLATGLWCSVSLAQQAQPQPRPAQPVEPRPGQPVRPGAVPPGQQLQPGTLPAGQQRLPAGQAGGQLTSADQQIASLILGCCHNEVEISKFVQSKLQSPEVKEFAENMISDHTANCETYQRFAGKQADAPLREGEPGAPRPGTPGAEGQPIAQRGGPLDWNKIHEQLAQQGLATAKQELGRHQGAELDHAYMGMQLAGHMMLRDELKVLRNHTSGDLQQQIDKSLQVVQGHLQQARKIKEQLRDGPSERVSRRPEGQPERRPEGRQEGQPERRPEGRPEGKPEGKQ